MNEYPLPPDYTGPVSPQSFGRKSGDAGIAGESGWVPQ